MAWEIRRQLMPPKRVHTPGREEIIHLKHHQTLLVLLRNAAHDRLQRHQSFNCGGFSIGAAT